MQVKRAALLLRLATLEMERVEVEFQQLLQRCAKLEAAGKDLQRQRDDLRAQALAAISHAETADWSLSLTQVALLEPVQERVREQLAAAEASIVVLKERMMKARSKVEQMRSLHSDALQLRLKEEETQSQKNADEWFLINQRRTGRNLLNRH